MKRTICLILMFSCGGAFANSESPSHFRARVISVALTKQSGEPRCLALAKLFNDGDRECTTDLDCEAKEEFNKQGCCWNDGLKEPRGC